MNELWDIVFEQSKAKGILENIYNSRRVPHAFLFSGMAGVGKYFTALQYAKLLNRQDNSVENDRIQKKISRLEEPYIKLIMPLPRGKGETGDDSSLDKLSKDTLSIILEEIQNKISNPYYTINISDANTIKINSIREIKKLITISRDEIPFRVIIILDAHLMNDQSQNALLKNLEEPPEGIIFFLITSDNNSLLPTIRSRCWNIDFDPLSINSIKNILIEYFSIEPTIATAVAELSDGSINNSISLLNQDFKIILERAISILRYSLGKKYNSAYKELDSFISEDNNNKSIISLTQLIKRWLNDTVKNKFDYNNYFFKDYEKTLDKFNTRFDNNNVYRIFTILDNLENYQSNNANLNVVYLNLIFEIASMSIRK